MKCLFGSSVVTLNLSGRNLKVICNQFAQSMFMISIVSALSLLAVANTTDPMHFRGGLRNSNSARGLSDQRLQTTLKSLRHKIGFLEMHFDQDGYLKLGDRGRITGGSSIARGLLISAVDGDRIFELEAYDCSPSVAFANIGESAIYTILATGARIEVRPIRLDFFDFAQLRGEREVLAAFDIGFAILHELAHGSLRLKDSVARTRLGDCDEHINLMRRQLGLPERRDYSPIIQSIPTLSATIQEAELIFVLVSQKKTRRFYLRWDVQKVAALTQ